MSGAHYRGLEASAQFMGHLSATLQLWAVVLKGLQSWLLVGSWEVAPKPCNALSDKRDFVCLIRTFMKAVCCIINGCLTMT